MFKGTNLKLFCKERGLLYSLMTQVKLGKERQYQGWFVAPSRAELEDRKQVKLKHVAEWEITDPNGKTVQIENLSDFCRESGLAFASMVNCAYGKQASHKGYTVRSLSNDKFTPKVLIERGKGWRIEMEDGTVEEVTSTHKWLRTRGWPIDGLRHLISGKRERYKNVTACKAI